MKSIDELVTSLTSKGEASGYHSLKSLGLVDASNKSGTQKVLVGSPEGLPNVIVKVLKDTDVCALFLWAVYKGLIASPHFPVVYAFTKVPDGYLAVMERCTGGFFDDTEEMEGDLYHLYHITGCSLYWDYQEIADEGLKDAIHQIAELDQRLTSSVFKGDLHNLNYARRSETDSTIVLFDPVFNRTVSGDVFESYWPVETLGAVPC